MGLVFQRKSGGQRPQHFAESTVLTPVHQSDQVSRVQAIKPLTPRNILFLKSLLNTYRKK